MKKAKKEPARTKYVAGKSADLPAPREHVIVHLNIERDQEGVAHAALPYDSSSTDFAYIDSAADSNAQSDAPVPEGGTSDTPRYSMILEEFANKTDCGNWPASTNAHCFWCCHAFSNSPVSLPLSLQVRGDDIKGQVQGCFCSFQCATAFNFDSNNDVDDMWAKYTMLNRLYAEHNANEGVSDPVGRVLPAPPRVALQMFGGPMSIEAFRAKSQPKVTVQRNGDVARDGGTFVDVLRVPLAYVPQQIEEINEADVARPLRFIPVDQDRINKVREKLQLKRSKPVNSKNTLDNIMNIRIGDSAIAPSRASG